LGFHQEFDCTNGGFMGRDSGNLTGCYWNHRNTWVAIEIIEIHGLLLKSSKYMGHFPQQTVVFPVQAHNR
jgi:hypothetical protein